MNHLTAHINGDIPWTSIKSLQYEDYPNISSNTTQEVDAFKFINKQAGVVAASLYEITRQLHLVYSTLHNPLCLSSLPENTVDYDMQYDIWVDMPPIATKKVVIKARKGGRGQPLTDLGVSGNK